MHTVLINLGSDVVQLTIPIVFWLTCVIIYSLVSSWWTSLQAFSPLLVFYIPVAQCSLLFGNSNPDGSKLVSLCYFLATQTSKQWLMHVWWVAATLLMYCKTPFFRRIFIWHIFPLILLSNLFPVSFGVSTQFYYRNSYHIMVYYQEYCIYAEQLMLMRIRKICISWFCSNCENLMLAKYTGFTVWGCQNSAHHFCWFCTNYALSNFKIISGIPIPLSHYRVPQKWHNCML